MARACRVTEADAGAESRLPVRLLLRLLPVTECGRLLNGLGSCWREFTGADASLVASIPQTGDCIQISLSRTAQESDWFERRLAHADHLTGDELLEFLLDATGDIGGLPDPCCGTVLVDEDHLVGAVLLFGGSAKKFDADFLGDLANVSAKLILQGRFVRQLEESLADQPHSADPQGDCDDKLLQAKLEALAEFAAGAGHEINNPLAVIVNRAQRLLGDETDPERRRELRAIGAQAYRIRDMIGDVMLFARPPQPNPESLGLGDLVQEVVEKLRDRFESFNCKVTLQVDEAAGVQVWADPVQLRVALSELLKNALQAAGQGGDITIIVGSSLVGQTMFATLHVTNSGPGLTAADREHLFDPFYSGRQAGRGLGFGLSKCWRIVTNHGGRIDVQSQPQGPTTLTVFWPQELHDTAVVASTGRSRESVGK